MIAANTPRPEPGENGPGPGRHGNWRHGHAGGGRSRRTPTYTSWLQAKNRCHNADSVHYAAYGARGIYVEEAWRTSFVEFLADMGERPPGTSLERLDPHGPYVKGNCAWASPSEQARNKSNSRLITFQGRTMVAKDWAAAVGLNYATLLYRLDAGWPVEKALQTPPGPARRAAPR